MDHQHPVTRESSLVIADISVDAIIPNPNNPNEMDEATFTRLCEEITEYGILDPITVKPLPEGKYFLLAGEHRWKAAIATHHKYIPSIIISNERFNDPDVIDLITVRMNEIRGRLSPAKLAPIYDKVVAKHGEEAAQKILGITHDDLFRKMVRKMASNIQKSLPPEMAEQVSRAAGKAKDPSQLGRSLAKIFTQQAKTMESNCFVFQSGGKKHIMVKCNPDLFAAMSEVVRCAQGYGEDINDVLFNAILPPLKSYQKREEEDPILEQVAVEVQQ